MERRREVGKRRDKERRVRHDDESAMLDVMSQEAAHRMEVRAQDRSPRLVQPESYARMTRVSTLLFAGNVCCRLRQLAERQEAIACGDSTTGARWCGMCLRCSSVML